MAECYTCPLQEHLRPEAHLFEGDIVTLKVEVEEGSDAKSFKVHEKLLAHHSPWFEEYFVRARTWTDRALEVRLRKTSEEVLSFFCSWIYTGKLIEKPDSHRPGRLAQLLCEIWVFGNEHSVAGLKNAAIDEFTIHCKNDDINWVNLVPYIHEHAAFQPGLWPFAIEAVALDEEAGDFYVSFMPRECLDECHADFVSGVLMYLYRLRREDPPVTELPDKQCAFHDHEPLPREAVDHSWDEPGEDADGVGEEDVTHECVHHDDEHHSDTPHEQVPDDNEAPDAASPEDEEGGWEHATLRDDGEGAEEELHKLSITE